MLCIYRGYGLGILLAEFPGKKWTKGGIDTLLSKLKHTAATEGRLNCVNTTWCGCVEPRNQDHRHTAQYTTSTVNGSLPFICSLCPSS